jgi:hypothetical protein
MNFVVKELIIRDVITIGGSGGSAGCCFSRTIIVPPTGGVGGCKYLTNT